MTFTRICAVVAALLLFAACTFVNIEGDHNTVSDTGGHGGGVAIPTHQPTIGEQLRDLKPKP